MNPTTPRFSFDSLTVCSADDDAGAMGGGTLADSSPDDGGGEMAAEVDEASGANDVDAAPEDRDTLADGSEPLPEDGEGDVADEEPMAADQGQGQPQQAPVAPEIQYLLQEQQRQTQALVQPMVQSYQQMQGLLGGLIQQASAQQHARQVEAQRPKPPMEGAPPDEWARWARADAAFEAGQQVSGLKSQLESYVQKTQALLQQQQQQAEMARIAAVNQANQARYESFMRPIMAAKEFQFLQTDRNWAWFYDRYSLVCQKAGAIVDPLPIAKEMATMLRGSRPGPVNNRVASVSKLEADRAAQAKRKARPATTGARGQGSGKSTLQSKLDTYRKLGVNIQ